MFLCKRLFQTSQRWNFKLRDYQQDAIDSVLTLAKQGIKRSAVVMATGGGKTVVFSHLIPLLKPLDHGDKTLVLAHTEELINQASDKIKSINPDLKVDKEIRKLYASDDADVVVASVQSIIRRNRYERFDPKEFKTIIIDECHHSTAKSYMKILSYFNALTSSKIFVIGFTATLTRHDKNALNKVFDKIAYERNLTDMIDNNELSRVKISVMKTNIPFDNVPVRNADYESSKLYQAMGEVHFNDKILLSYLKMNKNQSYKSTLIFCVNVQHCWELCGLFQSFGINAQYVTGETSKVERENLIEDFRNGKVPILCNVGVFIEGTDIPNIDSVILARPTLSKALMIQMVGRGLRLYKGKTHCHIIDLVELTLGGLEIKPTLQGKNLKETNVQFEQEEEIEIEVEEVVKNTKEEREKAIKNILQILNSGLFELKTIDGVKIPDFWLHDNQTLTKVFFKSAYPWVNVKTNSIWILQLPGKEFLSIEKKTTMMGIMFELNLNEFGKDTSIKVRSIFTSSSLMEIFEMIELRFKHEIEQSKRMNVYYKFATEKQVAFIMNNYTSRIDGFYRKHFNFGKLEKFRSIVESILQKERLGSMSKFITSLKYGNSNSYTFIKWSSIFKKALIEMKNEKYT